MTTVTASYVGAGGKHAAPQAQDMSTATPPAGDAYLVVGYDGSPPADRALEAAAGLLEGRTGRIDVVYVAHIPSIDMMSAGAVGGIEFSFGEIAQELRAEAGERLGGREDGWEFERREGVIADQLIAAATTIRDTHPGDSVTIVVGASSHALHHVAGSVAISLARHSPVPLLVVP
jgi:nucleotide-binding universal stress UspA family protein